MSTLSVKNASITGALSLEDESFSDGSIVFDRCDLVDVVVGEVVSLNLSSEGTSAYLLLYNADTDEFIQFGQSNSEIIFTPEAGINYEVRVSGNSTSGLGSYTLSTPNPPDVDLSLTSYSIPDSIRIGENFEISWTVTNQGTETTTAENWGDTIYLTNLEESYYLTQDFTDEPLAAGESYTKTRTVSLPASIDFDPTKTWYVEFSLDDYASEYSRSTQRQAETDEANRFLVDIDVIAPDTDLSITAVAPNTAKANDTVEVSWTVENKGTEATPTTYWFDEVRISEDEILDDDDAYVGGSSRSEFPLAGGDSYTANEPINIGNVGLGDRYLIFSTDRSTNVYDSDRSNNTVILPIEITGIDVDLVVSEASAPVSAAIGETVTASWTVTNQGSESGTAFWSDILYLSSDEQLDENDTYLTQRFRSSDDLLPGGSYTRAIDVTIPISATAGNQYVLISTDIEDNQFETSNGNNLIAIPLEVSAPDVDLELEVGTAPPTASPGEQIALTWSVTNLGGETTNTEWYDEVFFSSDPELSGDDIRIGDSFWTGDRNLTPLAANESYTTTQNLVFPETDLSSGYLLVASNRGFQYETNNDNNLAVVPVTVGTDSPNLVITSATAPNAITLGSDFTLEWTVENQGLSATGSNWTDYVYLSQDDAFSSEDVRVGSVFNAPTESLQPGESYTLSETISLNSSESINPYLIIATDDFAEQPESDDTDNFYTLPISLLTADLAITEAIAPTAGILGESIDVSWTVVNQGNGEADRNYWYDYIYLSDDEIYDNSDTYVGSRYIDASPLAVGASYSESVNVRLPQADVGDRYLLVVSDRESRQKEGDETNNTKALPITLSAPNLQVSEAIAPTSAVLGERVNLSWTVENTSSLGASADWYDYVYLSDDEFFDNNDAYVGRTNARSQTPLAGESSYTLSNTFEIPETELGDRYMLFVADGNEQQGETNETDNVQAVPISLSALDVDLVVSDIVVPTTAKPGEEVEIAWTLTNQGADDITGSWQDTVEFRYEEFGYRSRRYSFTGTIAAGESIERRQTIALPETDSAVQVTVVTDSSRDIIELGKEDNNERTAPARIVIDSSQLPNLQVSSIQVPDTAFSSQEAVIEWTVSNVGEGPTNASFWYDEVWLSTVPEFNGLETYLGRVQNASYLDAGESYQNQLTAKLPDGIDGNYFFLIETDTFDNVYELDNEEDNTSVSAGVDISLTPPPDLQVTNVSAPTIALSGQPVNLSWTVSNEGDGRTLEGRWWDEIYLSEDAVFSDDDRAIRAIAHSGSLNPGESYQVSQQVTLPDDEIGDRYVFVKTDTYNNVFENTFEDNNTQHDTTPLTIQLTPPPDLTVLTASASENAVAGKGLQVQWSVTNQGFTSTDFQFWTDRIVASTNDVLGDADDVTLATFSRSASLDVDGVYSRDELISVPFDLEGQYQLFVVADANNSVFEANFEDNNASTALPVTITTQPKPDLQITQIGTAGSAQSGERLTVNWTVENKGVSSTNTDYWYDDVYLSLNESLDTTGDVYLGRSYHSGRLAEGESYQASESFVVPNSLQGNYYTIVRTDTRDRVIESAKNNNTAVSTQTVAVGLGPAPDLAISSLTAPDEGVSGQPLSISWQVNNEGDDTTRRWNDTFYLSRDQIFDRSDDIYLGYAAHSSGLAANSSYSETQLFDVEQGLSGQFYVIGVADSGDRIYERNREDNNTVISTTPINILPTPPADFVVGSITVPANGIPGQSTSIEYTVENQGSETAIGRWYDSIYLSADEQWDVNDSLIERTLVNGPVGSGQSYTQSVTAALPGVLPGDYSVIVRSDIRNSIRETNESNNAGTSAGTTAVDAEVLNLGVPDTGSLPAKQSAYYKIELPVGETIRLKLDGASNASINELYIRKGEIPTRAQFDLTVEEPFTADPEITVPISEGGTYYILAYGDQVADSADYSISAEILPFIVESVEATTVGNAGLVTLEVKGAKFADDTAFQLVAPDGTTVSSERYLRQDPSTAYVTFDLGGEDLGLYDVRATAGNGEVAILNDVVTVEDGNGGEVSTRIEGPQTVRPERNYLFDVNYSNSGDTDVETPLILLMSDTNTPMGLELDEIGGNNVIQLLGTSGGQIDTLRPGEQASIPVYYNSANGPINFNTRSYTSQSTEAINWDMVSASVRPFDVPKAQWDTFWERVQPRIGDTWGDYVEVINNLVGEYVTDDVEVQDARDLFSLVYAADPDYLPAAVISGQLLEAGNGEILAGVDIAAYEVIGDDYTLAGTAVSNEQGEFIIGGLEAGSYELALGDRAFDMDRNGEIDADSPTYTVPEVGDVTGLEIFADTPEPPHVDESDASVIVDAEGTTHVIWNRNGEMWHAHSSGNQWVEAAKVDGAAGDDFQIRSAGNLIDGNPGLIATWRAGKENASEVYYAVGRETDSGTGYEWSAPIALTDDDVYDDGISIVVDSSGTALVIYEKSDYSIQDDSDLYFQQLDVQSGALNWPIASSALSAASAGELTPQSSSFSASFDITKSGSIPRIIPIIGGRSDLEISGSIKGSLGKEINASGSIKGELSLFNSRVKGSLSGSVNAQWNLHKPSCTYRFHKASMGVSAGISADIPGWIFSVDAPFVGNLFHAEVGIAVSGSITGDLTWSSNADFPYFPDGKEAKASLGLGPYGKASIIDGLGEGKVSGTGSMQIGIPDLELQQLGFTLAVSGKVGPWSVEWSKDWNKNFNTSSFSTLSDNGVLPEGLVIAYDPATGTGNVYGTNSVVADVSADLYDDRLVESAIAPDDTPWMVWARDTGEISGGQLLTATFDGTSWTTPTEVVANPGYLSGTDIAFDADGNAVVVWTAVDTSSVTAETASEDVYKSFQTNDLFSSSYQNGSWSAPSQQFVADGNDVKPVLGNGADGNLVLSWISQTSAETDRLMASAWDGTTWSAAAEVDTGNIVGDATISVFNGATTLFWSENVSTDPAVTDTSLFYSVYDASAGWGDALLFSPEFATLPTNLGSSSFEGSDADGLFSSAISVPSPPEELCECEEGDPECEPYEPDPVVPSDPNDILGPDGFGEEKWVTAADPFDYTIRFENQPSATAPAQEVVITQQLDADLDWRTFRVDDFGWGSLYFDLAGDRPFYNERVDLTEDYGFFVDVFTSLDITTGIATWTLKTIDPTTGEAPLDALAGFLPINNDEGIGEGFVSYSIQAKKTASTGDVVDAEATIVFDTEEPIDTPPIFNTLDMGTPTSNMSALPALIEDENESGEFLVEWSGSDDVDGSGLAGYTVYVAINGGDYTPWLENTILTEATYTGEAGSKYDFYVVATDNAGNTQPAPAEAQASTRIAGGVPILKSTSFDVISDHVLLGQADVKFTVTNEGATTNVPFTIDIVHSDDDTIGNDDDTVVETLSYESIEAGGEINYEGIVQLPVDMLNALAASEDSSGQGQDYQSGSYDYLGIVIDPGNLTGEIEVEDNFNQGKGTDKDDITYFPWDINSDGLVAPTDAIYVINRLGQGDLTPLVDPLADFDGNGVVTPTDAIAAINRLGYSINSSVFESIS